MPILPGGFSPMNALKAYGDTVNPFNGQTDYDIFTKRGDVKSYYNSTPSPTAPTQSPYIVEPNQVPSNIISNYESGGGGAYSSGSGGYNYAEPAGPTAQEIEAQRQAELQKQQQISFYDSQIGSLRDLLGRTDVGLTQGLSKLDTDLQKETGYQTGQKDRAMQGFSEQETDSKSAKDSNYNTINKNANNGYRSLAQIIGRASGTGSSAFQEMLPDVIGKDIGGKRTIANETYGGNMQKINKGRGETELSFANILAELAEQRKQGEQSLRTEVEGQRQNLNSQLGQLSGQRAAAAGGDLNAIRAAQDPYTQAVNNSRNQVTSFFDTFKTPYQRKEAVVARPELSQYTADRSTINAQNQPGASTDNPYSDLLRKRLQEGQVA